jgi:hypothetical protein
MPPPLVVLIPPSTLGSFFSSGIRRRSWLVCVSSSEAIDDALQRVRRNILAQGSSMTPACDQGLVVRWRRLKP